MWDFQARFAVACEDQATVSKKVDVNLSGTVGLPSDSPQLSFNRPNVAHEFERAKLCIANRGGVPKLGLVFNVHRARPDNCAESCVAQMRFNKLKSAMNCGFSIPDIRPQT